jgi:hypothetical protein
VPAVSGIAARMDFSIDGLEDLKIILKRAFVLAINDQTPNVLTLCLKSIQIG